MHHQRKPPSLTLSQLWKSRGETSQAENSGVVPTAAPQTGPELPPKREHTLPPFRPELGAKREHTLPPFRPEFATKRDPSRKYSLPPNTTSPPDISPTRDASTTAADSHGAALDDRDRPPLTALLAVVAALLLSFEGGRAVYRAFSDAWVSPIVLSPDSDLVLTNKLSLIHLTDERDTLHTQIERDAARLAANTTAVERLSALKLSSGRTPDWMIPTPNSPGHAPSGLPPERVQLHTQQIKIELDLLELEAETRAQDTQLQNATRRLAQLEELVAQIKTRPVFRAIEGEQDIAFVAHSQLSGVGTGASVLKCSLLGLFFCTKVGSVSELLSGEVTVHDAWGAPKRGQYAVLRLTDRSAAHAHMLHVRPAPGAPLTD